MLFYEFEAHKNSVCLAFYSNKEHMISDPKKDSNVSKLVYPTFEAFKHKISGRKIFHFEPIIEEGEENILA